MDEHIEIDLKEFFSVLVKKIWIVLLCAVILGTSAYVYTLNFVAPMYKANVSIYVNNNSDRNGTTINSADLAVALRLVQTYVNIIQSDAVLDKVISETGLLLSADQVRAMITAEAMEETEMFKVTVTTPSAQMSADLANAIATVAPGEISNIIEGSSAKVIDHAKVPKKQASPNYVTSAALGAVVGAAVACLVILIQVASDKRIKSEEDLLKICDIPVMGVIPSLAAENKQREKKVRR